MGEKQEAEDFDESDDDEVVAGPLAIAVDLAETAQTSATPDGDNPGS